jgi:hypothetical protein
MVSGRMGLLDDAIREHLELKRRRGADPGEVAREQREALAPIPGRAGDEDGPGDAEPAHEDVVSSAPLIDPAGEPLPAPEDLGTIVTSTQEAGAGAAAVPGPEETAELDMSSVLDAAPEAEEPPADTSAAQGQQAGAGDSLEWEMPADTAAREQAAADEPSDEDVLEETPDFLRETPEQDRLWFEQRPPRDFDFDK